jgi:hypothetical protein
LIYGSLTVKRFTPTITPVAREPAIVPVNGIDLPVNGIGIFTVLGCVPVKACPATTPVIACVPLFAPAGIVPVSGMPCPAGKGVAGAGILVPVKAVPPANAGLAKATDKAITAITAKACLFTLLHILYHPLFVHF